MFLKKKKRDSQLTNEMSIIINILLWSKKLFLECSYFHSLLVVCQFVASVQICWCKGLFADTDVFTYVIYLGLLRALIAKFSLRQ